MIEKCSSLPDSNGQTGRINKSLIYLCFLKLLLLSTCAMVNFTLNENKLPVLLNFFVENTSTFKEEFNRPIDCPF